MGGSSSKPEIKQVIPDQTNENKFRAKYALGNVLGAGAFGEVRECFSLADESEHAVKLVDKKLLTREDKLSLMDEVAILQELNHSNIIKLLEVVDEPNMMYIVTDLVKGGELFDRIVRKEKYSEADARRLVKEILITMTYLHNKGIVHRDLKPENLLLVSTDNDHDIKICDFGLAKRTTELVSNEVACGTPGYVSPEILLGIKYGTEVDIWSVGVITYILLCGYPPFYDDDQKKLFKRIKMAKYSFHDEHWSNKSKEVKDLISCMLCKDQKKRWTSSKLLEHPWMLQDEATLASNSLEGSQVTMRKFNARRRFKAAAHTIILTNRIRALTGAIVREIDKESKDYKAGIGAVFKEDSEAADNTEIEDSSEMNSDLKKLMAK